MTQKEFDLGFEITFNTQHGKNAMFLIMQEFLGGWQLKHKNGTCYDRHLNAIYDAIKTAEVKKADTSIKPCPQSMKSLARIEVGRRSLLLLVEFDRDVSMFKDKHGIIHLENIDGKLVVNEKPGEQL